MNVYAAINAVQNELSKIGISKDRKNVQQGFAFRGIDDIYNAVAPLLASHGLCILPRVISRECTERMTAKGGTLFYVVLLVEFDFVCAEDGSKHTIITYGEAMDSGDKATNKAMSAAYKYALLQAFCIPTEADNDPDATTHNITPLSVVSGRSTLPLYPQERFDANKQGWKEKILNGKNTTDALLEFMGKTGVATEEQKAEINSWKPLPQASEESVA